MEEGIFAVSNIYKGSVEAGHHFADFTDHDVAYAEVGVDFLVMEFDKAALFDEGHFNAVVAGVDNEFFVQMSNIFWYRQCHVKVKTAIDTGVRFALPKGITSEGEAGSNPLERARRHQTMWATGRYVRNRGRKPSERSKHGRRCPKQGGPNHFLRRRDYKNAAGRLLECLFCTMLGCLKERMPDVRGRT